MMAEREVVVAVDAELDTRPRCTHLAGTPDSVCAVVRWMQECACEGDVDLSDECRLVADVCAIVIVVVPRVCKTPVPNPSVFPSSCQLCVRGDVVCFESRVVGADDVGWVCENESVAMCV